MTCHVKTKEGAKMFTCCNGSCWNVSNADDCLSECCVKYGKCENCDFYMDFGDGEYVCELEQ